MDNDQARCPYGTVYDTAVHAECPCPSCWADRSSVRLTQPAEPSPNDDSHNNSITSRDRAKILFRPEVEESSQKRASPAADASARRASNIDVRSAVTPRGRQLREESQARVDPSEVPAQHRKPSKQKKEVGGPPDDITLRPISARNAALLLGALAIPSALLSTYAPTDPWSFLAFRLIQNQPLLPAFYFGLVLCTGVRFWESTKWKHIVIVFGSVFISWICAYQAADHIFAAIDPKSISELSGPKAVLGKYALAISGLAGGFVGSLGITFGIALVSSDVRNRTFFVRIVCIGTAAGASLQIESFPVLYLLWQPAIAGSVAYGVVQPKTASSRKTKAYVPTREAIAIVLMGVIAIGTVGMYFKQRLDEARKALIDEIEQQIGPPVNPLF